MKQHILWLCLLLLGISAQAQQRVRLTDFTFGYYTQTSTGTALDYAKFVQGSKNEATMPSPDQYSNSLDQTLLNQSGLSFGFHFNLLDQEEESLPHFFSVRFRNSFPSGVSPLVNSPLDLTSSEAGAPRINMIYRTENFGIGLGYRYRLLNKKAFQFYAGLDMRIDAPISSKMISTSEPRSEEDTVVQHVYYMDQKASFFAMPHLALDLQVTHNLGLSMAYKLGLGRHPIGSTALLSRTSIFEIGLKFNLK